MIFVIRWVWELFYLYKIIFMIKKLFLWKFNKLFKEYDGKSMFLGLFRGDEDFIVIRIISC